MGIPELQSLIDYILRVLPALAVTGLFWWMVRPDQKLRVGIYVLLFILFRDAMTGAGLWSFGTEGGFWIRLSDSKLVLLLLGSFSILVVFALWKFDIENRKWVLWRKNNPVLGVLSGLGAAVLIFLPVWLANHFGPSLVPSKPILELLPYLLFFALCGNLYEEFLFRGYIRGMAEERFGWVRASFLSGITFAFFHIYLATTVSSVGAPLLLFTLWEGVICGFLASRWGILSSTIAHGTAIWLLASGF